MSSAAQPARLLPALTTDREPQPGDVLIHWPHDGEQRLVEFVAFMPTGGHSVVIDEHGRRRAVYTGRLYL